MHFVREATFYDFCGLFIGRGVVCEPGSTFLPQGGAGVGAVSDMIAVIGQYICTPDYTFQVFFHCYRLMRVYRTYGYWGVNYGRRGEFSGCFL